MKTTRRATNKIAQQIYLRRRGIASRIFSKYADSGTVPTNLVSGGGIKPLMNKQKQQVQQPAAQPKAQKQPQQATQPAAPAIEPIPANVPPPPYVPPPQSGLPPGVPMKRADDLTPKTPAAPAATPAATLALKPAAPIKPTSFTAPNAGDMLDGVDLDAVQKQLDAQHQQEMAWRQQMEPGLSAGDRLRLSGARKFGAPLQKQTPEDSEHEFWKNYRLRQQALTAPGAQQQVTQTPNGTQTTVSSNITLQGGQVTNDNGQPVPQQGAQPASAPVQSMTINPDAQAMLGDGPAYDNGLGLPQPQPAANAPQPGTISDSGQISGTPAGSPSAQPPDQPASPVSNNEPVSGAGNTPQTGNQPTAQPPIADMSDDDFTTHIQNLPPEQQQATAQQRIELQKQRNPEGAKGAEDLASGDPERAKSPQAQAVQQTGAQAVAQDEVNKALQAKPDATPQQYGQIVQQAMATGFERFQAMPLPAQIMLGLGLSVGLVGMFSSMFGEDGGMGDGMMGLLGIGAAGLIGANYGMFGNDARKMMGQGALGLGRMMGMNIPDAGQLDTQAAGAQVQKAMDAGGKEKGWSAGQQHIDSMRGSLDTLASVDPETGVTMLMGWMNTNDQRAAKAKYDELMSQRNAMSDPAYLYNHAMEAGMQSPEAQKAPTEFTIPFTNTVMNPRAAGVIMKLQTRYGDIPPEQLAALLKKYNQQPQK